MSNSEICTRFYVALRDPRATFLSQFAAREMFKEWTHHFKDLCENIDGDAKLGQYLPSNRFAQLIYEDLVKNPIDTLTQLYKKLQLPIDVWSIRALQKHLEDLPSSINITNSYMSLYRGSKHDENAWKTKMKPDDLQGIESVCKETMLKYGYTPTLINK